MSSSSAVRNSRRPQVLERVAGAHSSWASVIRGRALALVLLEAAAMAVAGAGCGHQSQVSPGQPPPTPPGTGTASVADFFGRLPPCSPGATAVSPHAVREQPVGTKVSARGVMLHNPKWDCSDKGCPQQTAGRTSASSPGVCCGPCTTPWMIVDAAEAARPYMSRSRLYLRARGASEFLSLSARDCDVSAINALPPSHVIVSGTFKGPARRGGGSYLLDDTELCAF